MNDVEFARLFYSWINTSKSNKSLWTEWLEKWYSSMCDGNWEHFYGIKINTLDNPGWIVQIDINNPELEKKNFSTIDFDNNDNDWLHCHVKDGKFKGFGDNLKLVSILEIFKEWIEN